MDEEPKLRNVRFSIEQGHDLVIRIDLRKRMGPSKSGKSTIVASTGGNHDLGVLAPELELARYVSTPIMLGINAYTKE